MATGSGFGYKIGWLAVRDRSAEAVAAVLGLGPLTRTPWPDAVAAAYADGWLLTPPLDGWTLAASRSMPTPEDRLVVPWVAGLSASLGDVQYFITNRVTEYHGWARASGGVVERAFGYHAAEAVFEAGERSAEELALGVGFIPDADWWESDDEDDEDDPLPDEDTVLTLAGQWSFDPRTLEDAPIEELPWTAGA
jgi:hypothetical protein